MVRDWIVWTIRHYNRCGHLKEDVICLQAMSFDVAAAAAKIKYFLREKKNTEWNNIENVQT